MKEYNIQRFSHGTTNIHKNNSITSAVALRQRGGSSCWNSGVAVLEHG